MLTVKELIKELKSCDADALVVINMAVTCAYDDEAKDIGEDVIESITQEHKTYNIYNHKTDSNIVYLNTADYIKEMEI